MCARTGSFFKVSTHRAAAPPRRGVPVNREKAKMIRGVFVVMAVVVIGSVATTYWFGLRVLRIYDRAALHRKAISETQSLLSTLKDAETGQRGFLLTGDEQYLGPYNVARVRLPDELTNLRRLADVDVATRDVDTIEKLAEARLEEAAKTIETRRRDGINAAMEIVRRGEGKQTMD